jgi:signal transduction histidine kinase/ligand-binding sensor domain-containing protein
LNPGLDLNQYAHKSWTIREGFLKGIATSIAQTPDGYLWLGTEFGLLRFDGVRPVPWSPPGPERLPSSLIYRLLAARDGTLWIGTDSGLASWSGATLTRYPQLDQWYVQALIEGHDGAIWVAASQRLRGRVCVVRAGAVQCEDSAAGRILALYEDTAARLWAGGEFGLWRWRPGPPAQHFKGAEVHDLGTTADGQLLVATSSGLWRMVGGRTERYAIRGAGESLSGKRLLRDRDGGMWVGTTGQGLFHLHQARIDRFSRSDGLSSDPIMDLFEDREGNVWVATAGGIDRFGGLPVTTLSAKQGLSNGSVWSVLAARDGTVWLAGPNGLDRWSNGQVKTFGKADGLPEQPTQSLLQDGRGRIWAASSDGLAYFENGRFAAAARLPVGTKYAIVADRAGDIWLSQNQGLARLTGGRVVEQFPWSALSSDAAAWVLAADLERGGLWLGFASSAGVAYFKDGQIRESYTAALGLGEGRVTDLQVDRDGTLWASTYGGLSLIRSGTVATLSIKNGLPCNTVYWRMEANDHSNWLYSPCGLVRLAPGELDGWAADPKRKIRTTVFDGSDGVVTRATPGSVSPRVAKDADGTIWLVGSEGISVFDPAHLPTNKLPPPVHIESLIADDKPYPLKPGMRLPANVHTLRIEYTALSLVAPEKIHFKYKLEGQNKNWHELINERQVTYTNLGPRNYRFRVIACNNSGVWNETGDTLEFSIAPAWNQTTWFYASCVIALLAMLWGLYRLRLYQIAREFNAQLDGRVDERLRVARELHDTMLQSFQAALIQMQAAYNIFGRRPEKAGESLEKAINTAAGAIAEGRGAIQDLRLHAAGGGDLVQLITTAGQELARSEEASGNPPVLGVTVEGARRDVAPLIQDEVYRIARELLRNAFHHAEAGRIEVEIRYDSRQLRLHVRDDGKGIDSEVLRAGGRSGHYGLPGMRERANRFGGKLDFWSEAGAGTEAVLTVPAAVAYGGSNGGRFAFLRRKLWIHER